MFSIYFSSTKSEADATYDLKEFIAWPTDVPGCFADKIYLCSNSACTGFLEPDNSSVFFRDENNPTTDPVLTVKRDSSYNRPITLRGKIGSILPTKNLDAEVIVCSSDGSLATVATGAIKKNIQKNKGDLTFLTVE